MIRDGRMVLDTKAIQEAWSKIRREDGECIIIPVWTDGMFFKTQEALFALDSIIKWREGQGVSTAKELLGRSIEKKGEDGEKIGSFVVLHYDRTVTCLIHSNMYKEEANRATDSIYLSYAWRVKND